MEIILLKDLDNLGYKHDVVSVKNGYGRNYLIPKGMAVIANPANLKKLDEIKAKEAAQEAARLDEYQVMATKLTDATLKIGVKAGTSGKIFGSVTNVQISQALKDQYDIDVDRRKIVVPEEIKEMGNYEVILNLHPEVTTNVAIELVQE